MKPTEALERIVYLLDRDLAPSPKVRAFANANDIIRDLGPARVQKLVDDGHLQDLDGIGDSTGQAITEAVRGEVPAYLQRLEETTVIPLDEGRPIREALRGDCHSHSHWSDGGAPIEAMALAAQGLGHDYLVMTDHSPRLTIAHGLTCSIAARIFDSEDSETR